MNIPFIILSYSDFNKHKKLFSYELNGINTLPIFTNLHRASVFATTMSDVLAAEFCDDRLLEPQICSDPIHALHMFETIVIYHNDLMRIIIDPHSPIRDDTKCDNDSTTLVWVEHFEDIDDVVEQLQSIVSSNGQ